MNFTPTHNPDNRHVFLLNDKLDDIIIGGTVLHVFTLPFRYFEFTDQNQNLLSIVYKQGLDIVLEKGFQNVVIDERKYCTIIKVLLMPEETKLFKQNCLDTFVQIKVVKANGDVLYNDPYRLIIKKPLDQ